MEAGGRHVPGAPAASSAAPGPRRLDDVIDELGVGYAQVSLVLSGALIFMFGGSLMTLFSVGNDAVAADLRVGPMTKGALLSVVFIGKMIGNLASGFASDLVGRRPPLLASNVLVAVATLISASVPGSAAVLFWRCVVGVGLGLAIPPWSALAGEMCPSTGRLEVAAAAMALFCIGSVYTLVPLVILDTPYAHLAWRELTVGFAMQGLVCFGIAYAFVPESVRYLDRRGDRDSVVAVLNHMRAMNGRSNVDISTWRSSELELDQGFAPVCSRTLLPTTLTMCLTAFFLNFSYYGQVYALPQVLPGLELGVSMLMNMLIASLVELAGYGAAVVVGRRVSRQAGMLIYLFGVGLTTALFWFFEALVPRTSPANSDLEGKSHMFAVIMVNVTVSLGRFCQSVGWTVCYVYCAEVYPTSCRACGCAVAAAFGRLGGITAPMAFEVLLSSTGGPGPFFLNILALAGLNAVLVLSLPVETKDRQLGDIAEEEARLCKHR